MQALQRLESYEIPNGVVSRLVEKPTYGTMSAADIIERIAEFKKFVALLVINHDKKRRVEMTSEEIDEIWHTFILFTKEYQEFCNLLVGEYIHHEPNVQADNTDQSAVRNYSFARSRNFREEYDKYFGALNKVWTTERLDPHENHAENDPIVNRNRALAVTLAIDALLVLFLVKEFSERGHVVSMTYAAMGYAPVLVGGIIWSRLTAGDHNRKMIAIAVMIIFSTLLGSAVIFAVHWNVEEAGKTVTIGISAFLFFISAVLFASLRVKRAKNQRKGAWGGCGSVVGVACSGGDGGGGGGGCGGGGCGG